jgi:hypothetical protein
MRKGMKTMTEMMDAAGLVYDCNTLAVAVDDDDDAAIMVIVGSMMEAGLRS